MTILDQGRVGIAAQAQRHRAGAYDAALGYARERKAFGSAIGSFQMIQAKIADMKTRLSASRLLMLQAAWAKQAAKTTGARTTTEGSMAKLFASETAMFNAHAALQIHGGLGYSKEMPLERYFRDAKITEIYEGTSEIQRIVIARQETWAAVVLRQGIVIVCQQSPEGVRTFPRQCKDSSCREMSDPLGRGLAPVHCPLSKRWDPGIHAAGARPTGPGSDPIRR